MAGRGPAPKPANLRQRRNKKTSHIDLPVPDNASVSHALPAVDHEWHPLTLEWWQHVWESPMAGEYLQTDVDGLGRLAILIDAFYRKPNPNLLKEIRLQEARFGFSPVDRARLQWEVLKGEEAEKKRKPPERNPNASSKDPRGVLGLVK